MKNKGAVGLLALLVVLFLSYILTFQVRFNQAAVVTTFGKADSGSVFNADGQGAGLYAKWPWPVQDVRLFDTRIQMLETPQEEHQTKDNQTVILQEYLAWKISQPLEFFRSLKNTQEAEEQLRHRVRDARLISRYSFDELTNSDPAKLKLSEAEGDMRQNIQEKVSQYGIEIKALGIKRILLPESVTKSVFERMKSTRQRLAQRARSEGEAAAKQIRDQAQGTADRIEAFAKRQADAIRAEGDAAAARHYDVFKQDEQFSIFLRKLEALKQTLQHNTTFLLDTRSTPFDLFTESKAEGSEKEPKK